MIYHFALSPEVPGNQKFFWWRIPLSILGWVKNIYADVFLEGVHPYLLSSNRAKNIIQKEGSKNNALVRIGEEKIGLRGTPLGENDIVKF